MGALKVGKSSPLLDRDFVNAFVDGVKKALATTAHTLVTAEKPFVEENYQPQGDVAGVMGMINGDATGNLTISFSRPALLRMVNNMLHCQKTDLDQEVTDAVGEMTNQIYGTAKSTLNQMGYRFEMALPAVIMGQFSLAAKAAKTVVIPFKMPDGEEFVVALSVPH